MKILFRCDGGDIPEISTGHITRCLLLADLLVKDGNEVAFVISEDEIGLEKLRSSGFPVFHLSSAKLKATLLLEAIRTFKADVLVIDRLNTQKKYVEQLKDLGVIVVTLDDRGTGARSADFCINGMLKGVSKSSYEGYRFVVLPYRRTKPKVIRNRVKNIFISFGGYDHLGLIQKVVRALEALTCKVELNVVTGGSISEVDGLTDEARRTGKVSSSIKNVNFFKNVRNFDAMLEKSDIALVAGGLTVYHAISCGVPTGVISQYAHQRETAEKLEKDQAVVNLGDGKSLKGKQILKIVKSLCDDKTVRTQLSLRGRCVVDRLGTRRVANLIQVVKILNEDSRFFGKRAARIYPTRLNLRILKFAFNFCRRNKVDCLYYFTNSCDIQSIELAEKNGFQLVEIPAATRKFYQRFSSEVEPTELCYCKYFKRGKR